MDYQTIEVERQGPVGIVRLNRPTVMNALHPPAHHELAAAWDHFATDPELWVGIVTGAGERVFCAGNDLKFQAAGGALTMPASRASSAPAFALGESE